MSVRPPTPERAVPQGVRVVSPTVVTPAARPVAPGPKDTPRVIRGEVVRPRRLAPGYRAAATTVLLSAVGAASVLFLLMRQDHRHLAADPPREIVASRHAPASPVPSAPPAPLPGPAVPGLGAPAAPVDGGLGDGVHGTLPDFAAGTGGTPRTPVPPPAPADPLPAAPAAPSSAAPDTAAQLWATVLAYDGSASRFAGRYSFSARWDTEGRGGVLLRAAWRADRHGRQDRDADRESAPRARDGWDKIAGPGSRAQRTDRARHADRRTGRGESGQAGERGQSGGSGERRGGEGRRWDRSVGGAEGEERRGGHRGQQRRGHGRH